MSKKALSPGHSKVTALKHANLASLVRMRVYALKNNPYFAHKIHIIDAFAGNGQPTEDSDTTSSEILFDVVSSIDTDRTALWLNDICERHVIMLREKFTDKVNITAFSDKRVYVEIARGLTNEKAKNFYILFIDPNNINQIGFDELLTLLKMKQAKEMDLIINIPATALKRDTSTPERLRDYVKSIMETQPRKGWLRRPVSYDKWQWAMIAFFNPQSAPKGKAMYGWCDIESEEGRNAIEYFSTTSKEKQSNQLTLDELFQKKSTLHTVHIKNISDTQNLGQSGIK